MRSGDMNHGFLLCLLKRGLALRNGEQTREEDEDLAKSRRLVYEVVRSRAAAWDRWPRQYRRVEVDKAVNVRRKRIREHVRSSQCIPSTSTSLNLHGRQGQVSSTTHPHPRPHPHPQPTPRSCRCFISPPYAHTHTHESSTKAPLANSEKRSHARYPELPIYSVRFRCTRLGRRERSHLLSAAYSTNSPSSSDDDH